MDLAARDARCTRQRGGRPKKINPLVPVDLVIDHSVQVDEYATPLSLLHNVEKEFESVTASDMNFLSGGSGRSIIFRSCRPPRESCIRSISEHLAKVVHAHDGVAYPDTLVGTDSHFCEWSMAWAWSAGAWAGSRLRHVCSANRFIC